jgi:N-acetylneuraminate lyase
MPELSLIAATFTAFAADGGVDLAPIEAQAAQLAADGVQGAFVCGSSGEGPSLTSAERVAVAERWCRAAPPGQRVIVHIGHASIAEARALAAAAEEAGAHAIAAVPPFYFRPAGVDEAVACCAEIAAAAPRTPFIYYHIPAKTHVALPVPELIAAAARIPTFAGVKFTHTNLVEMARCVDAAGEGAEIFCGPDELLLDALLVGVRSAVGTSYNLAGPLFRRLGDAFFAGDLAGAAALQRSARDLIALVHRHGGLPAFKALTSLRGPDCSRCRLPLPTLDAAQRRALHAELAALGPPADLSI